MLPEDKTSHTYNYREAKLPGFSSRIQNTLKMLFNRGFSPELIAASNKTTPTLLLRKRRIQNVQ